jgi:hypothetical protein
MNKKTMRNIAIGGVAILAWWLLRKKQEPQVNTATSNEMIGASANAAPGGNTDTDSVWADETPRGSVV